MTTEEILRDFDSLPPEAQRQVADFIAFLLSRYRPSQSTENSEVSPAADTFIGMWRDRADLQDSSAWVRSIRKSEWGD